MCGALASEIATCMLILGAYSHYKNIKVRLDTAINRADFVSWCMLYTYEGNKMASVRK